MMVPSYDPHKALTANLWDSGVWLCPSAPRPSDWPKDYGYDSYGYNARGLGDPDKMLGLSMAWKESALVNESAVTSLSDMLAVGDAFQGAFENGIIIDGGGLNRRSGPIPTEQMYGGLVDVNESTKRAFARHSGNANMAFCDGHVAALTLNSLFVDTSDASLERWNRDHQSHRDLLSNK
ncbi:MAG TPA: H-X9-DG-CTERM domain-containing protein [Verrucomicrobiae bacterium]